MNSIQILWSVSPLLAILCLMMWVLCACVCAVCLFVAYGWICGDGEDVLICEEG